MTVLFTSPLAADLVAFLTFKRNLGYRYSRAEFTLRSFDQFLSSHTQRRRSWRFERVVLLWLASRPKRKAVSVSMDAAVLRQFCKFMRRRSGCSAFREPHWPQLPTSSSFVPYVLSIDEIKTLLHLTEKLDRPEFRRHLYRALLLTLYCTGIRFGEALRLRIQDVDVHSGLLFITESKGRSRWVPFDRTLGTELNRYLTRRRAFAPVRPLDHFFVGANQRALSIKSASYTLRKLFRVAGLKPESGRIGPRPYDLRHTFAVHRLTRWYRQGVNLHARLPWLSAYMGHDDIMGTETYLHATAQLLAIAADRFRRRYFGKNRREW